mmetsp:Transcript_29522/g.65040  ORF Transcript_29522/g.65040 Transcript_29522/m.65040 type:complete len:272 (-) Transcript_29522:202-1017(-)
MALLRTIVHLYLLSSPASAFAPPSPPVPSMVISSAVREDASSAFTIRISPAGRLNDKDIFLNSLDDLGTLNQATKERSSLLNNMIGNKSIVGSSDELGINRKQEETSAAKSIAKPGSLSSFSPVAPGSWRVVYAPHMTTMANLAGGSFQVEYDLNEDGTMESHAKYDFPIVGQGYLSVSGTYSSVDDTYCRVDFDEAWIRKIGDDNVDTSRPYATIDEVPDSISKTIIRKLGRFFFFDAVSVFPVSFLDDNLIVFDFELLGTRITARKVRS